MPHTMTSATVTIVNELGLHARPAARVVQLLSTYKATVIFEKEQQRACGDSIMELMMLMAGSGDELTITASGPDATVALNAVTELVKQGFQEGVHTP